MLTRNKNKSAKQEGWSTYIRISTKKESQNKVLIATKRRKSIWLISNMALSIKDLSGP